MGGLWKISIWLSNNKPGWKRSTTTSNQQDRNLQNIK